MTGAHDIAELRRLLREQAGDQPPEAWGDIAFPDFRRGFELLPVLRVAPPNHPAERVAAQRLRSHLGRHIAAMLELLSDIERIYAVDGAIWDEGLMSDEEAARIVDQLIQAGPTREPDERSGS
jgi:hypothetical protein